MKALAASLFVLGMVVSVVCAVLVSMSHTFDELCLFATMLTASSGAGVFGAWMLIEKPQNTGFTSYQCQGGLWI